MHISRSGRLAAALIAAAVGLCSLASCGQQRVPTSQAVQRAQALDDVDPVAGFGGSGGDLWVTTPGGSLYLSTSGGSSWIRRTPPVSLAGLAPGSYAVAQSGASLVWLVAPDRHAETLFESDNGGRTWPRRIPVRSVPIPRYAQSAVGAYQVYAQLLNSRVGFVVLDGYMTAMGGYWTLDESTTSGASFRTTPLPASGPVRFSSSTQGFLAGGPAGQDLYRTADGSATWQQLDVTPPVAANWVVGFPLSQNATAAIAPVTVTLANGATELYSMRIALAASAHEPSPAGAPLRVGTSSIQTVTASGQGRFFAIALNSSHVYTSADSGASWTTSASKGLPAAGAASLVYTGPDSAVAELSQITCSHKADCVFHAALYATNNDGRLWRPMDF
jgi:hypothetical protein